MHKNILLVLMPVFPCQSVLKQLHLEHANAGVMKPCGDTVVNIGFGKTCSSVHQSFNGMPALGASVSGRGGESSNYFTQE